MSEKIQSTHSGLKTLAIFILIIMAGAVWYFAIYEKPENFFAESTVDETGFISIETPEASLLNTLALDIDADVAAFRLYYLPATTTDMIKADWEYEYGISEQYTEDPMNISITSASEGNIYTIYLDVQQRSTINPHTVQDFQMELGINPNFMNYSVDADLTVGGLEFTAINKTINYIDFHTTTGYQEVFLRDVTISERIALDTTTGGIRLEMENLTLEKNVDIDVDTTTGGGEFMWTQIEDLGANISLDFAATTGGYEISIRAPLAKARYDVSVDHGVGGFDLSFDPEFVELAENHYQSSNYPEQSLDLIVLSVETTVGGADISIDASDS